MTKYYHLLALSLSVAALTSSAAEPFRKGFSPPPARTAKSFRAPIKAPQTQTLLEEDFAKFTDGSEDSPGAEIEYADRYHIPDHMTAIPGWTGGGIYPSGGSVTLMDRSNDDRLGFISTPAFDLGGTATLTFRARNLPGHSGGSIWVALCDNYYGPGEDQEDFELSDNWETYTMVASHGELDELSYFQLQAEYDFVQIDDIRIDFVRDRIPTPYPFKARNISPTEFVAGWEDCGAPMYRLNVLCKEEPADVETGTLLESFDGININSDGATINLSDPNYPEGWEIDLSSNGSQDISTEPGTFHSAPMALLFDAPGDVITSPSTPLPVNGLKFWVRPTQMEDDDYSMSLLRVEIYHSLTDKWENIAHLPYYWMTKDGDFYEFEEESLGEDVTRVRLSMIQRGAVDFLIDDVTISYSTRGVTSYLIKDLDIEETEYTVSGINPANEYSYYVQAVDDDLVSPASYVIWVDGISGLKPEVLEPTDINPESFTANWKQLGHATDYKVETSCTLRADADMPGAVILEEDFNAIDNEGTDWISPYNFAEHGMANTGWCATQPAWKSGMAGTQGTSWMGAAGLVFSPRLNLSGNAGEGFDVEATVVTTVDSVQDADGNVYPEGVFVMVLNSHNDTQAVTAALIETPAAGSHSATVHVPNPEGADLSDVIVAFMNMTGTSFYVDNVKITQDLKAGEETDVPHSIKFANGTSTKIEGIREGFDHSYRVTASTRRNYEDYVSEISDVMQVPTSTVDVKQIAGLSGATTVSTSTGTLNVTAPDGTPIEVYASDGTLRGTATGSLSLHLAPGTYIVKADSFRQKIMVK